jgi:hypothetical protein
MFRGAQVHHAAAKMRRAGASPAPLTWSRSPGQAHAVEAQALAHLHCAVEPQQMQGEDLHDFLGQGCILD